MGDINRIFEYAFSCDKKIPSVKWGYQENSKVWYNIFFLTSEGCIAPGLSYKMLFHSMVSRTYIFFYKIILKFINEYINNKHIVWNWLVKKYLVW